MRQLLSSLAAEDKIAASKGKSLFCFIGSAFLFGIKMKVLRFNNIHWYIFRGLIEIERRLLLMPLTKHIGKL